MSIPKEVTDSILSKFQHIKAGDCYPLSRTGELMKIMNPDPIILATILEYAYEQGVYAGKQEAANNLAKIMLR